MHANAASALEEYATPGARVLDVGCGSGYLTAVPSDLFVSSNKVQVLARMVQPDGKVVGIEHLPELSALARKNLLKDPETKKLMDAGQLIIVTGDGREGYAEEGISLSYSSKLTTGPYDAIHVGAAAPVLLSESMLM